MFVTQLVFKSFALLVFFVPLLSVVFAQEDEEGDSSSSLLLTNYNALREEGQGFYLEEKPFLNEQPDSVKTSFVALHWWCDLEFSSEDATNKYGYVGRGVKYFLGSSKEDAVAQGSQSHPSKKHALSVSAVLVPTLGIFEGQIHATHDDWVYRYWDDGSSTLPILGWEGHDEGDTSPNAKTSAWSGSGTFTKITTEAAAELLGMDVADMTPTACSTEYEAAWNATHVPDSIETSVTDLEDTVAQLQADNKELLSRIVAIEENLTAPGSSSSGTDGAATAESSSSSPDIVMKTFLTEAVLIVLVLCL